MLVAACDRPCGFVVCELPRPGRGRIGLIAVARSHEGRGVGRQLVDAALRWFAEQGAEQVDVVTQQRNIAAMRFYEACGFSISRVEPWFHRWFER